MLLLVNGLAETQEVDSESASAVSSEGLHDLEIEDVAHKETEHTEGDEEELGVQDVAPKKSEPIQDLQNEAKGDEEELASGDVAPKEREPIQDSQSEAKGDDEDSQSETASQTVIVPPQDSPSPVVAPISITESNKVLVPGKADVPSQSSVVGNLGGRRLKRLRTISSKLDGRFQFDKKTKLLVGHPSPIADLTSGYLDPKERFNRSMKKLKAIISISLVGDVTISSKDVLELIERKKTLSNKVMDGLLKFSRHILQTDEVDGAKLRADVLDTKSISQLCRLYPKFFKAPVPQDFQFPTAFVDAVSGVGDFDYAELFTEITVLDCNVHLRTDASLKTDLEPVSRMLPILFRQGSLNPIMTQLLPTPFSIERSLCIPQVTAHVDAGLMTVFLIHAHAVGGMNDCAEFSPDSIEAETKKLVSAIILAGVPYFTPLLLFEENCPASQYFRGGLPSYFWVLRDLDIGEGTEPHIQTGDGFDLHPESQSTVDSLNDLRRLCHIPPEVEMVVPKPYESPESGREGYCCAYKIYFKGCGLFFPLPEILLIYLNHLGIAFSQMSPNMLRYLMCTFTVAAEAGYSLGLNELLEFFQARESRTSRMGLTHPVDPLPAEIDLSSLNARDRRKIREADKKVKDQISQIGKNKKNASSAGDDKIYRKTLLVDDGSLEGSKSMEVTINNAPPSTPAADNMGRPKSTRKDRAAPSNLSIPESAEAQDENPDSGIVLKEPLNSGMLPPRHKEKIGNMFRCFHTRFGKKLPSFERWRPDIKKMYISHSFHSSQATLDVNGIINHYEEELAKVSKKAVVAEGEIEKLQSSSRLVQETAGLDSARREEIERLERSGEETKKNLTETEQKLKNVLADHDFAKGEIELMKSELSKVKTVAEDLERKNESLSVLKDQDVRKISHDARKEVKGAGQKFLLAVQEFFSADNAWNKLKSERDEMKSNLDLIKEIEEETINLAEEKETVGAELSETEAKLATAPQPYLDLQQFASEFADSPPLTEPNTGLSLDEMMLTGSPRAHFNEFGTNIDRISSGRTQGFPGQDLAISSIMGDVFESRSEPPQGTSSLNPEVVLTTQDANIGGAPVSSQVGDEGGEPSDPNPPRFPSGESLFPTGDGFTPHGVAIPCFLSSMSKEEKIECHEFMEQITERYVFFCSERQRLGRKRRVLEDRIARTERKIRRLESDVHNWERRGFDSIARIPGCLRKHIRFLKKHWDIYQRSLEPDERENGNSSENPSDSFRMVSDDLPGAPDIGFIKTGGTGEPEESRILRRGTSIQVPIVLIERLSAQDRIKAEEFINKLITRHDELEDEKKEIRKRRRELEKRRLDIARELHRLEAHPSDWIEIGLQEYEYMPGCIMSIVDLAGQGAELFCNPRPF
ncbi:hypothetical protein ISN44_As06g037470 [Arabidopsis suecica]|uniref:Ubiquitin-like protease family profile domain-containing protein n=1 Tax=Arabidopsis suecica TaxID=45249 RepID=A0A8T2CMK0_ARASU|nr:hypothetical protein ISN44_As06g037470 [Arabidopsis suecica]